MKPKTMILMVVAVGCGLGASYMTSKLLADRNNKPQEVPTVPVLVAKVRVPGWQPIKEPEKQFELKQFPVDVAPKRAIGDFAALKDQRLNKPLDETKPVTMDDLLTNEQQTLTDQLQPGQRAVAIKVTTESIVGGFVLPGSRVDVICTMRGSDPTSTVVLQNMLVLAVDTQSDRNPEQKSIIAQTVTLAATPLEATRLALASEIGQLRLSLKNQGDNSTVNHVAVKASDLQKPITESNNTEVKPEIPVGPAPLSTPLPVLPADDKGPKIEEPPPPPAPAPKPKKRHVMTIQNGTQREKAVFTLGEEEEEITSTAPATETNQDEQLDNKPNPASKSNGKAASDKGRKTSPKMMR